MATTSSFGGRRSRVSFDRVELDQSGLGDRAFELSEAIELGGKELPSVTWVYDPARDSVVWSSPIERLFGFEEGIRGFAVLADDVGAGSPVAAEREQQDGAPDEDPDQSCTPAPFAGGADFGDSLLSPILAPIRAGVPPSEFDLHREVHCPDGVIHRVVVRASPMPAPVASPELPSDQVRAFYVGVVVDVTAQQQFERELGEMVDRYRLLTEVSPDVVFVHQNGRFVFGNRAMGRLIGAGTDEEYAQVFAKYYGQLVTDFTDPEDLADMAERLAQLTEPGQFFEHGEIRWLLPNGTSKMMEITSIRTSWAGEPAYQVIARDISERRAAEAANRYRASLVAHVSDAIIGIDADGRIESWNEAAQAIYGGDEE